ncbi:DUF4199 domain-containing protein [Myroides odoratimimus]|uniref:DUF4199 domain-containing protein n=1 Tax=Myroides odoratimimus TaxID=76832 RepID=UPI001CE07ACB|nr:DUF4199 domain-containing protein [Myroides odoratimimus]MCA4793364.1 DUF4199 domain-containing protein [Myroides odoratimimus]MCA4820625.1 DUF4199 domain-containing protein [Myroides odoratimimus]MDM1059020.1 DUF4199 domain-containing protein [Myroides odoratimimus]MDM1505312.1 DUF4199 domain-containing protein [Myroides odoratimimus]MDM1515739.1 DUF4199 domain-containing protein [Myroides odoratimimus]
MKNPVNKVGITFGIILAIYYTLFNSVIFFTDKALFANTFAGFFNMGVMVILGILTIYFARKKAGGYVTFREAFTPFFLMVIIGVTVNIIIYNILFNIVDPSAKEEISKSLYDMLIKTLDGSGLPQEQINEQLEKARNINQFAPKSQLFLWAGSVLRNSILGILLAAIFKNKSEFVNPHPEVNHDVDTDFNKDHK